MIESPVALAPVPGINRNIVECKVKSILYISSSSMVLIETLWNVKTLSLTVHSRRCCINRNIVECKEIIIDFIGSNRCSINRNIVECKDLC